MASMVSASTRRVEGAGISLRRQHYDAVLATDRRVDWLEIQPENFMGIGGKSRTVLDRCAERHAVVPHGVALSLGGPDPLSTEYLDRLKELTHRIGCPWFSEHASFAGAGGQLFHELLPLPFTEEAALHLAGRTRRVADHLELPVLVENVTYYAAMPGGTLTEGEFLAAVIASSGAGLLLDVNNVFVNAENHGVDPREALVSLPLHATRQIHLAGHRKMNGYLLDDHGAAVTDAVWDLYELAVSIVGPVPTLVEWENHVPSLDVVLDEADRARAVLARHIRSDAAARSVVADG